MTQLHRQRGTLPAGMPGAWGGSGLSLQQQHHQQLMAAAAAAAAAFGGGGSTAWVPSSSSGVRTGSEPEAGPRLSHINTGSAAAGLAGSGASTPLAGAGGASGAGGAGSWGTGFLAEEQALLLDASGKSATPCLCAWRLLASTCPAWSAWVVAELVLPTGCAASALVCIAPSQCQGMP